MLALKEDVRTEDDLKNKLAQAFLDTFSFKDDPQYGFTLSSGIKSQYYVDCKVLMANPPHRKLVAQLAFEKISKLPIHSSRLMISWMAIALRTDSSVGVVTASS